MSTVKVGDRVSVVPGAKSFCGHGRDPKVSGVVVRGYPGDPPTARWFCVQFDAGVGEGSVFLESDLVALNGPKKPANTHASLERVFALAVAQTRDGKGADRHGNGQTFEEQPILAINKGLDSNHGSLFQVIKKAYESARLQKTGRTDMAKNELLGAMVYAAAAYIQLEAQDA